MAVNFTWQLTKSWYLESTGILRLNVLIMQKSSVRDDVADVTRIMYILWLACTETFETFSINIGFITEPWTYPFTWRIATVTPTSIARMTWHQAHLNIEANGAFIATLSESRTLHRHKYASQPVPGIPQPHVQTVRTVHVLHHACVGFLGPAWPCLVAG